jgi:hypothetical protein
MQWPVEDLRPACTDLSKIWGLHGFCEPSKFGENSFKTRLKLKVFSFCFPTEKSIFRFSIKIVPLAAGQSLLL